ncbi:glycosyltransferase family 4 protein [Paenibacillus nasutitermitis]|uniref:Glycosyltransferase WbuB n=1 Tax=Paenibacillus nasutitermitis TaxID=1652958 RepID=A0A917DVW2_9BACL|nr:glycosyltransferase family 4 protein [Paenibacillus nasutitermitis]GGD76183.1 glycosyltransferase WbuB [Paenibacillus nasutitermitis]
MKRNIVFVINYFYPDYASTGQLLTELCLHIQDDFNITVIAAQPGYAGEANEESKRITYDNLENIRIIRIKLPKVDKQNKLSRLRFIATYFFYANILVQRQKNLDFIYTISQPPILGGLIGTLGKLTKRAKHIYNIQDFNPEQAEAVGFSKNKQLFRAARWVDTLNCKYADHIITVGQDMQETLLRRFADRKVTKNTVINNWTNEQDIIPLSKQHPKVAEFIESNGWQDKFIVMYSGNLGLYYDLENVIKITKEFKDKKDLVFVFIGEGAVKKQMQQFVDENQLQQVYFLPYQPIENIKYSLNAADVHMVVNQKGIKGVSVPSKIYGVMAAGKPVFGVLERGSEAHRLIEESRCGVVSEPQDYEEAIHNLRQLYEMDRQELAASGMRGRSYLEEHLRRELSLEKYRNLLLSM